MAIFSLPEYGCVNISRDGISKETDVGVELRTNDFDALKEWCRRWSPPEARGQYSDFFVSKDKRAPLSLKHWNRREVLRAQNYVGVILLPSGDQLEILPKITKNLHQDGKSRSRNILLRILRMICRMEYKAFEDAAVTTGRMPLLEIFIHCFLSEVALLIRRGIRSDYTSVEDNLACLRGKLLMPQHIRYNTVHRERFYVQFDEYLPDRPENRLIKAALERVRAIGKGQDNLRRCGICLNRFDEVSPSTDFRTDFARLRQDRNTSHYRASLFWSRLILQGKSPVPAPGELRCSAILFPMEKLFEQYVAQIARRTLSPKGWTVKAQDAAASEYLIEEHGGGRKYQLKPDLLLRRGAICVIVDTKWKNIDAADTKQVDQGDLYQLFAYSEKYLRKSGCTPQQSFLIYPKTSNFESSLEFHFYKDEAVLKAVPFDLENDACELFTALDASCG